MEWNHKGCFCTVITADYLHYALALNHSLVRFHAMPFYVLVVDNKIEEKAIKSIFSNLHFLYLENINQSEIAQKIIKKYQGVYQDGLRWSPKSVLVRFLLDSYAKVLYLDCDLYFYNDYQFLLNELDTYNIILTPHWRNSNPNLHIDKSHEHFEHLFFAGLFNAGFIGCNQHAKHMIEWWAACCVKLIPQIVKSE